MKLLFSLLALLGVYGCYGQYSTDSYPTSAPAYYDRRCGEDLGNLWLDVVVVVDNSKGMTNGGLINIAANIASVFSNNTRIGSNPNEPRTTRLGVVTYNAVATTAATLDTYQSLDDVYDGIFDALSQVSSSDESYLVHGLAQAEDILEAGKSNKNRTHYQRVVIVYASTYKGTGSLDPIPVADRLKTAGVTVVTVAYDQDGDGALLQDLEKISTPPYNFSNTEQAGNTIGEIQGALLQVNCFCPNGWTQYRVSFTDIYSYRYGVCIQPENLNSVWRAAQSSCRLRWNNAYLATEFDSSKHNYILQTIRNETGFIQPFSYHIGLNLVRGQWVWDQPKGWPQPQLQNWIGWNPSFPTGSSSLTAVLNQQSSFDVATGWQNISPLTTGANYVCETASCDTENYCASVTTDNSVKH